MPKIFKINILGFVDDREPMKVSDNHFGGQGIKKVNSFAVNVMDQENFFGKFLKSHAVFHFCKHFFQNVLYGVCWYKISMPHEHAKF